MNRKHRFGKGMRAKRPVIDDRLPPPRHEVEPTGAPTMDFGYAYPGPPSAAVRARNPSTVAKVAHGTVTTSRSRPRAAPAGAPARGAAGAAAADRRRHLRP